MTDPRALGATGAPYTPSPAVSLEERLRQALAPGLLLVREIGAGGMARVFVAREPALKRLVAVKVLSGEVASSPEGRARFEREAQAVAGLSHPNIVAIHSVGELDDRTPYFVMQYVEGRSMSARVEQEGPLSIAEGRRVIAEVAAALAAAHRQGIIHRDIKPANILYEESTGRSLVSDFGIAAIHTGEGAPPPQMRLTATGTAIGTPQYMSPEQLLAEPVTEKTDVYSLGVLAHELLAGKPPFTASTPHELIAMHLRDTPKRLGELRPGVDAEFDEVIARCLEKDATKRPPAEEIAKRLSPGGGALLEWPPPGLEELHGKLCGVSTLAWWGGALLAAACVLLLSGSQAGAQLSIVMPPAIVVGLLLLGWALRRTVVLGGAVTRAVRAGYAWWTVAEVIADRSADTGNLITGSREYSATGPADRNRYRQMRVAREALLFGSGILALPLVLAAVWLGAAGLSPGVLWIAPAALALATTLAAWMWDRERHAFRKWRRRRSGVGNGDAPTLARGWNESFEAARAGQSLGRGSSRRPRVGRAGSWVIASAITLVVLLLVPYVAVALAGSWVAEMAYPTFANMQASVAEMRVLRPYRLPADTTITPLAAGRAAAMLTAFRRPTETAPRLAELPLPAAPLPLPFWDQEQLPAGLFPDARPDFVVGLPASSKIMAAVTRGLTPAELAYLERVAHAPYWVWYDRLARARTYDILGARVRLPSPTEPGTYQEVPIPRFTVLRNLAHASASRAAFHLAQGRRDSAETALRDAISVGLLYTDESNLLIESIIGTVMARTGGNELLGYYQAVRDPRAAVLKVRKDSVAAVKEALTEANARRGASRAAPGAGALRAMTLRYATDTTALRTVRYEGGLVHLGMSPCVNVRDLVFGRDSASRQALADARKTWTRFASDSALLDIVEDSPRRLASVPEGSKWLAAYGRTVGVLTGNPRVAGCTVLMGLWMMSS